MESGSQRRQHQVGLNEASYRRVNEGIAQGTDDAPRFAVLCECGRLGCNQLIDVDRSVYETVRGDARRFIIVPGHEILEAEHVVEDHGTFLVVEKHEVAGDVAERTDPRAPLEG